MTLLRELVAFLREHRRWWSVPVTIVLLLVGILVLTSESAIAPFAHPFL
jgi:hypothetical protein